MKKTSDILGTYPSTVSRTIRTLEKHLKIKLLGKEEGRISLTQEGLQYGSFIEKKLEEIRRFEIALSSNILELDIIATEWIINNIVIPAIPQNIKQNQNIRMNFSSSTNINRMKYGKPTIFIGNMR
ncbi:LysR family transcriptional regulator [Acetobacter cibinongensis]|uniref:LysR family transcriptional regulator n=1 Tax=Acetobacter cibinongensis TaxID=146475 RepID=UPI0038D23F4D